ncbi:MAG TPA: TerC/Alx family metal homeostasis membrane protein [Candidatus Saccharimonadales bacterium]|nr:TerC/Alx family metal homeostasis membrane protein [Candidatus Saccharimonadales bacterium]
MTTVLVSPASPHAELPAVSPIVWMVFIGYVIALLVLDLVVLNRKHEEPTLKHSALQTAFFVANGLGVGAALFLFTDLGANGFGQYLAAYATEWSLSVDNIFVIMVIMTFFAVPREYQHKVLFYGILGALVMRLTFILGISLVQRLAIVVAVMGGFLLYTAWKVATSDDEETDISKSRSYRLFTRLIPTTKRFYGDRFFTKMEDGRRKATPLFICVLVVEATDLVFALDSIPAVLGITSNTFVAFSSNVMAIMGLRAVFFLFGHIQKHVTRLNEGLAVILAFVGVKLIIANGDIMHIVNYATSAVGWQVREYHFQTWVSLGVIFGVLLLVVIASLIWPKTGEIKLDVVTPEESDETMVELYVDAGHTMDGEWTAGLVERYTNELVRAAGRYDTDRQIPVFAFAEDLEPLGTIPTDDANTLHRPSHLGHFSDLAAALRHAEKTAKSTTGRFIFAFLTDGRVLDERAAREVFVTMPSNAFVLFIRVSDEPGGAEFLQGLDDYNVGTADRCDTIHATDDKGQPQERIADVIGREVGYWMALTAV